MKEFLLNEFTHPAIKITKHLYNDLYAVLDHHTGETIRIMISPSPALQKLHVFGYLDGIRVDSFDLEPLHSTYVYESKKLTRVLKALEEGIAEDPRYRLAYVTGDWTIHVTYPDVRTVKNSLLGLLTQNVSATNILIGVGMIIPWLLHAMTMTFYSFWAAFFSSGILGLLFFWSFTLKLTATYRDWNRLKKEE